MTQRLTPWLGRKEPPYRDSPGPAAFHLMFAYQPEVVLQNKGSINVCSKLKRKVEASHGGGDLRGAGNDHGNKRLCLLLFKTDLNCCFNKFVMLFL